MTSAPADLVPATRNALALLLLSMADDELVLGFSDSEWTGIAPILEEDVAMSSLAQDELGHAQALYRLLADISDDGRDADAIAYDRPVEGYYHARLLDHARGDWATTIARRYLYDTADAIRLEALAESSYEPLRDLVGKIRREERYHLLHVGAWMERLANGDAESRRRLVAAMERLGPDGWTVLSPLPGDLSLQMAGIAGRDAGGARRTLAVGDRAHARGARPADAGPGGRPGTGPHGPLRRVPLAARRAHLGPPARPRGDLVTALGARGGAGVLDEAAVVEALRDVPDPEIPVISVVDLGRRRADPPRPRAAPGRAAAHLRRLPGPRPDARGHARAAGGARPRPRRRGRRHLRPAVDDRPDHARRPAAARGARVRPTADRRRRPPRRPRRPRRVPVVRVAADGPRERLRTDGVPFHPLLHGLPPAVRAVQSGVTVEPPPMDAPGRVGVVGAGTMGAGIAQVALEAGDEVALYDVAPGAVEEARTRITEGLGRRAAKLGLDGARAEAWVAARTARLHAVDTLAGVAPAPTW